MENLSWVLNVESLTLVTHGYWSMKGYSYYWRVEASMTDEIPNIEIYFRTKALEYMYAIIIAFYDFEAV